MKRICLLLVMCGLCLLSMWSQNDMSSYAMRRGIEAWQQGDYQTAIGALGQELKSNPQNGIAYAVLAFVCNDDGSPKQMVRCANRAIQYLPKNEQQFLPEVLMMLAKFYWQAEDTLQTEKYLTQALKVAPKYDKVYYRHQQFYGYTKRFDDMIVLGKVGARMIPNEPEGFYLLYDGYMGKEQYDDALKVAEDIIRVSARHEKTDVLLPYSYVFKVRALIQLKRYNEALPLALNTIAKVQTNELLTAVVAIADSTNRQAVIDSLTIYEQKFERSPWWSLLRAQIYEHDKRYGECYVELYRAMQIQEMDHIWRRMGSIAANHLNDLKRAKDCYEHALLIDSTDVVNRLVLADYYYDNTGDYIKGDEALEKAIHLDALHSSAYIMRGRELTHIGDYKQAIENFYCALVANPDQPEYYFRIARIYAMAGDTVNRRKVLDKACALYKTTGRKMGSEEYIAMGDFDNACKRAVEDLTPDASENEYYNVACTFALAGRNDEAIEYLRLAMDHGFLAIPHMKFDTDLDGLREMSAFKLLMAECEKRTTEMRKIVDTQLSENKL